MALAVAALQERQVNRIILTRPAVEAGERLGFLPGDILAKVDPYLRPLYDALYDMLEADRLTSYMERGIVEVAPLAFMRGRPLDLSSLAGQNTPGARDFPHPPRLRTRARHRDVTQVDSRRAAGADPVQTPRDDRGRLHPVGHGLFTHKWSADRLGYKSHG